MKYHLTPIRMLTTKEQKMTSVVKDVEKLAPLCTVGGSIRCCSRYGKHSIVVPQKIKIELPYDLEFHFWVYNKRIASRVSKSYVYTHVHSSIIHSSQKVKATQVSISR